MAILRKITPSVVVCTFSMFLLACTENIAYRHNDITFSTADLAKCEKFGGALELKYPKTEGKHTQEGGGDYYLGFVEVDEQGVFFDRNQFKNLTCELASYAESSGILISVFVHGWHHNAKDGDDNIENFKASLVALSQFEHQYAHKKDISPRKTIGIYIGWRGESIDWDLLSYLTFWDRKKTAEEIGRRSVLEALLRIESIRNIQSETSQANRLFVVGHSFGADVVYNALSPIMLERLIANQREGCDIEIIKGFGDLVFLINPAFESLQYINFSSLLSEKNCYHSDQFPIFSILTSQQDKATKYAFPAGRKVSTLFETYRDIEVKRMNDDSSMVGQRDLDTTAIGHEEIFFTHILENNETDSATTHTLPTESSIANECKVVADFRDRWMTGEKEYVLNDVILKSTNQYRSKTPYLVIKVDEAIIPDHNKIYATQVLNFMRRLVVISTNEEICSDPQK